MMIPYPLGQTELIVFQSGKKPNPWKKPNPSNKTTNFEKKKG